MLKPILCNCGKLMDARSKTKMCRLCYTEFRRKNRKPKRGGSQYPVNGKSHYERNKPYYYERVRLRKKHIIELISHYKKTHPCVDCGFSDFRGLQFDHVSGKKEDHIARAATLGWSDEKIFEEIKKCEVRCARCHQIITFERRKNLCDTGV